MEGPGRQASLQHEVVADQVEFLDSPKQNGGTPADPADDAGEEPY